MSSRRKSRKSKSILFKEPRKSRQLTISGMIKLAHKKERTKNKWLYTYDKSSIP